MELLGIGYNNTFNLKKTILSDFVKITKYATFDLFAFAKCDSLLSMAADVYFYMLAKIV